MKRVLKYSIALAGIFLFNAKAIAQNNSVYLFSYFNNNGKDRLMIQKVNPAIYPASYPCWILDYEKVQDIVKTRYQVNFEHINDNKIELDGKFVNYKGFLAELK